MHKHLRRDMIRLAGRLRNQEEVVRFLLQKAVDALSGDGGETVDIAAKRLDLDETAANVDEECLKIIAFHQPDENTLRHLAGTIKVANDLKRGGETALSLIMRLDDYRENPTSEQFTEDDARLAGEVFAMFDRAFKSFINLDSKEASGVAELKDGIRRKVENANHDAEGVCQRCGEAGSPMIRRLYLLGQLEMIAANCVNICLVTTGLAERNVRASMKPEEA